jgi:Flp pilus assembly pilin Flp
VGWQVRKANGRWAHLEFPAAGSSPDDSRNSLKGTKMKTMLARLWKEEEGQDLTEYALLLVLIALASMAALTPLATAINTVFANAASNLTTST